MNVNSITEYTVLYQGIHYIILLYYIILYYTGMFDEEVSYDEQVAMTAERVAASFYL